MHLVFRVGQRGGEGEEPGCPLHPWKDAKATWGGRRWGRPWNWKQKCLASHQVQTLPGQAHPVGLAGQVAGLGASEKPLDWSPETASLGKAVGQGNQPLSAPRPGLWP